ncbi:cobalamin-binding protein [Carboxydochorda subterranea]|uniref:Cobalamin-binding protein n=1 Tax=Carboxydichorda subterranea TaxID=3109565 RepID=A0ABZ1C414_9FIRM|nr:cobalamin-binding protein [Limnochorda sp. L945t]WRP18748.1 cobalamin-binding protein [Limnochorda sp. L945t]
MRIVSLVPSATELVWALGLTDHLVGRSHECDFPPEVAGVPVVTASLIPPGVTGAELDALVSRAVREHGSLYTLDRDQISRLRPDLILTQGLCEVCAVAYDEVKAATADLQVHVAAPVILSLQPMTLADVLAQLETVASAAGIEARGREVRRGLEARLEAVRRRSEGLANRPRVFCMEWLQPPWCAGHWVPEMVELAGGSNPLGQPGQQSRRLGWDAIRGCDPDVIVLMPCGYDLQQTVAEYRDLRRRGRLPTWWDELRAVRERRVFAVQASAYFNRPGPRVVDGVETLAEVLHPDLFGSLRLRSSWLPVERG